MPNINAAIQRFRAALAAREERASAEIVQSYTRAADAIASELSALAVRVETAQAAGQYSPSWEYQEGRLQSLLVQVRAAVGGFVGVTRAQLTGLATDHVGLAQQHTRTLIEQSLGRVPAGAEVSFSRLPVGAVESILGALSAGSPVDRLLSALPGEAAEAVKATLTTNLALGVGMEETARAVQPALGGTLARSLAITRTESLRAYRSSALATYEANSDVVRGWMWSAQLSSRTCAMCIAMHGTKHPLNEPFGSHVNCFPAGTMVATPRIVGTTTRWFSGEIVEIETALGNHLTVTPNHPILTPEGWVAAGLLHEGGYVISSGNTERILAAVNPNDNHVPARIENVVEAFGRTGGVRDAVVPVAPEDFHGDGSGSDVCIVRANSLLSSSINAALGKPFYQQEFGRVSMVLPQLVSLRTPALFGERLLASPRGLVGGLNVHQPLFRCALCGHNAVRGSAVTSGNISTQQHAGDDVARNAELFRQSILGNPADVTTDNLGFRQPANASAFVGSNGFTDLCITARGFVTEQSTLFERVSQTLGGRVKLGGDGLNAIAGNIVLDCILKVRVRQFSGHVYNLQSSTGWYIANNIITHNCRCVPIPLTATWAELGFEDVAEAATPVQDGADWFAGQTEEVQQAILGPGKLALYQSGDMALADVGGFRDDPEWGPVRFERSLRDIVAGLPEPPPAASGGGKGLGSEGGVRPAPEAVVRRNLLPSNPEWMQQVRQARAPEVASYAARHRMTVPEYEAAVAERLRGFMPKMVPHMRIPEANLQGVLRDDLFKNQFATRTSEGLLDLKKRARTEKALFGVALRARPGKRPVYGYLHRPNKTALTASNVYLDNYSPRVAVRFKRDVIHQATFTVIDSLDRTGAGARPALCPLPTAAPEWVASASMAGDLLRFRTASALLTHMSEIDEYVEAQLHGPVTCAQIEEVLFYQTAPAQETQRLLRQRGIRWRVVKG